MPKPEITESELVWRYFGSRRDGIFVEVGANHPTKINQTWFLETQGWTGVLIEPNPENCRLLREQRPKSQVFQVAIGNRNCVQEVNFQLKGGDIKAHSVVVAGSAARNSVKANSSGSNCDPWMPSWRKAAFPK